MQVFASDFKSTTIVLSKVACKDFFILKGYESEFSNGASYAFLKSVYVSSKDCFHKATSTISSRLRVWQRILLRGGLRVRGYTLAFSILSQFELWHKIALRLLCKRQHGSARN